MIEQTNNTIPSNEEIFSWIKNISSFGNRRPGTKASNKTTDFIENKFLEFGLKNVHLEPVKTFAWNAHKWGLTVNYEKIPCFYMPNSLRKEKTGNFSYGNSGEHLEVVYAGSGKEEDFDRIDVKGKIVLCEIHFPPFILKDFIEMSYFFYDPEKTLPDEWEHVNPYVPDNFPGNYYLAQKNGASGFIGILADYIDRNTYYNEDYSTATGYKHEGFMRIPGVYITKATGEKIVKQIKDRQRVQANIQLSVNIDEVTVNNVLGYLPGKSKDLILVHSHHDSVFHGAVQDASGTSIVLSLAKYFSQFPEESREKTILFATLDSHFYGYSANHHFIDTRKNNNENILIDLCVEHIALEAKNDNGKLVMTEEPEPAGFIVTENKKIIEIIKNAIIKNNMTRTLMMPTYSFLGVETDAFYIHKSGIPVISLISGPVYLYDEVDTPDKVAVERLQPTTSAFIDIIDGIDSMPAKKISHEYFLPRHRLSYYFWIFKNIIKKLLKLR